MDESHTKAFNANSAISLGLLVVVCGGIWQLSGILNGNKDAAKDNFNELKLLVTEQRGAIAVQEAKFDARFDKLERGLNDQFTATDMQRWLIQFSKANPEITVPDLIQRR